MDATMPKRPYPGLARLSQHRPLSERARSKGPRFERGRTRGHASERSTSQTRHLWRIFLNNQVSNSQQIALVYRLPKFGAPARTSPPTSSGYCMVTLIVSKSVPSTMAPEIPGDAQDSGKEHR